MPSSQASPSALATEAVHAPVLASQLPAVWHWSLAVHTTGLPPTQIPPWQVSVCVHSLPSLQVEPLGFAGLEHLPLEVSQLPALWQSSLALHTVAFAPMQTPFWQESVLVQALPSVQPVPLPLIGLLHTPVAELQVPASWHWSLARQMTGSEPLQAPAWQLEAAVHGSPSLHVLPSSLGLATHWPVAGLHVPVLHASPSAEQSTCVPA